MADHNSLARSTPDLCDVFHADPARVAAIRAATADRCRRWSAWPRPSRRLAIRRALRMLSALSRAELCVCDLATPGRHQRVGGISHQLRLLRTSARSSARGATAAWSTTASTTTTSCGCWRRACDHVSEAGSAAGSADVTRGRTRRLHRLRGPRRVGLQGRGARLPRGSRAHRAPVQAPERPRDLQRRRRGRPPARAVRRRAAVDRHHRRRGRRHRHARVARARRASRHRNAARLGVLLAARVSGVSLAVAWSPMARLARSRSRSLPRWLTMSSGGVPSVRTGLERARASARFDMHVLMTVAVVGAIAIGEWSEGATVVFLFALAQYLESRSMDRARHAIRALMDLTPPEATVVRDGAEHARAGRRRRARRARARASRREAAARRPRRVRAKATSTRRRSPGESLPVDKQPGDEVFAGSINGHGASRCVATRLRPRHDARAHHPPGRGRAGRARAGADVRRSLRAHLHARRHRAGRAGRDRSAAGRLGAGGARGSTARSCCWSSRARARSSSPRRSPSCRRWPPRHGAACSSRAALHLERLATVHGVAFDKTGTLTRGTPEVVEVIAGRGRGQPTTCCGSRRR